MDKNVVFVAKTDLNVDGRIINQIKILNEANLISKIDFILLPDKPFNGNLKNVRVHSINSKFRNNKFLRFFTVFDTSIKILKLLYRLKPDILHVQDTLIVLPCLIYRYLRGKTFKLIYDDHELPNENESLQYKFYQRLEKKLMLESDLILFANEERMELVKKEFKLKSRIDYFLNLPYYENEINLFQSDERFILVDELINNGIKFIIHQGSLEVERGRHKLSEFSKKIPKGFKILIVGVNRIQFDLFVKEFNLDEDKFYFFGIVNYELLDVIWSKCVGSIVMYLPTYINNRLCAPNRLYISLKHGLTVFINSDNPVLDRITKELNCGIDIENVKAEDFNTLGVKKVFANDLEKLIVTNKDKFKRLYKGIIY